MANNHASLPLTAALLVFSTPLAAQQTAYLRSTEPCQVTAYSAPEAKPLTGKLACDEKVTILERQGSFVRIRTATDRVTWVDDVSTTTETPAPLEVQRLTEYQEKIEKELDHLNKQVYRLSEQSEKLLKALQASQEELRKKGNSK